MFANFIKRNGREIGEFLAHLFILIVIIVLIVGGVVVGNVLWKAGTGRNIWDAPPTSKICEDSENISQRCIDYRIDQCMATERYDLDQCVLLVSK